MFLARGYSTCQEYAYHFLSRPVSEYTDQRIAVYPPESVDRTRLCTRPFGQVRTNGQGQSEHDDMLPLGLFCCFRSVRLMCVALLSNRDFSKSLGWRLSPFSMPSRLGTNATAPLFQGGCLPTTIKGFGGNQNVSNKR